ncbi:ABC transporter ATP-binding protein [Alphaproteobacteria bacterium]|nr:ABC transporter ATP-binding protein [Alphaproteobacteria bacterium]
MSDRVLDVENLTVDIPLATGILHAVDSVNLHVDRGETLCIVGESGCGKSLTSLALMDLLPTKAIRKIEKLELSGASILGYSERQMSDVRGNKMGMIFQEPMTSLNPAFTIGNQMIETLLRHRNMSNDAARELARRMLEKVGITAAEQRLGQYPHQLSGGLRQRVMIAMTLLCEPELIIADEPTTALDVTIQAQILLLLKELQNEFDMGLVLITHDLGVVARIATRVAVMYAGQIVEEGTAKQIFENPLHPYTRGLMRCIPVPGKTKRGAPLGSIPGMVPSLIGDFTGCRFADRCELTSDVCRQSDVSLRDPNGKMQAYRCIHSIEMLAKGEVA